ncbi:MAG: hypothetical protein U0163_04575 [Gemmatimonadaceae bacterium]
MTTAVTPMRFARRVPRLLLRRETLRRCPAPQRPDEAHLLSDRSGTIVHDGTIAYPDPHDLSIVEEDLMDVLTAMQARREHLLLGIVVSAATFRVRPFARTVERARSAGIGTVVELRGNWLRPALEMIVQSQPGYLRIGPDVTRGVSHVPDQFRFVVSLAEFAREAGVPLIARGHDTDEDLDALRLAGVELFHAGATAGDLDAMLFAPASTSALRRLTSPLWAR